MSDQSRDNTGNSRPRPRRTPIDAEEYKVWAEFYRQVKHEDIASDLVQYLDANPSMRERCPGLYLRAKQSMRHHWDRRANAKRVGEAIQLIGQWLLVKPLLQTYQALCFMGRVALETLPASQARHAIPTMITPIVPRPEQPASSETPESDSQPKTKVG